MVCRWGGKEITREARHLGFEFWVAQNIFLRYTWPLVPVISPGTKGSGPFVPASLSRFQNRDERGGLEPGQKHVSVVVRQSHQFPFHGFNSPEISLYKLWEIPNHWVPLIL